MNISKKHLRKVRLQNIRAFGQRGHSGLRSLAQVMGVPDESGKTLFEIGSSSIIDPFGHIAKLKMAMGLQPSAIDAVWASLGDTDASLYVGFQPGLRPTKVHPQLWLRRLAQAMPHVSHDTIRFVDKMFANMMSATDRIGLNKVAPKPTRKGAVMIAPPSLFPLRERTLQ